MAQSPSGPSEPRIILSLDYGTSTLCASYRIDWNDGKSSEADVKDIKFSSKGFAAPQQLGWDSNGKFHWGAELDDALQAGIIRADAVIELLKLLLYEDLKTKHVVSMIKGQMRGRSLHMILSTHLEAILATVREHIRENVSVTHSNPEVGLIFPSTSFLC